MGRISVLSKFGWTVAMVLFTAAASSAADWGTLKGRFVVDGRPPERTPLVMTGDNICTGQEKPVDETVVVGEKGGLANVAVYIWLPRGETIEIHPDYAKLASKSVELDNKNCRFAPHVTLLRTGQPLVLKNSDTVGHNTNLANNFNEIIASGEQRSKTLTQAAAAPIPVNCNIHPFMKAYVLLLDHPYMAVTDESGAFEIKNVPAGVRGFTFWHESPGFLRDHKIGGGTADRRGKVNLTIKAGETLDLGEIRVPVAVLKPSR